ncbi:hypothetical protein BG005_009589, partial [Podila minutissima]
MVNTQSALMTRAQELMKQKDNIEAEIRSLQDELQSNDHKAVMLQIEEALHAVHAEALAEREKKQEEAAQAAALQNSSSSSSTTAHTSQPGSGSNTAEAPLTPFAKVNAVAPDSPSKEA